MHALITIALFLALLFFIFFFTVSRLLGNKKYKKAKLLEKQKNYKDACYEYAIAILNGSSAQKDCRKRIKHLWEEYGPFDYTNVLERIKKEGDTPEGCSVAGHSCTMSIIEEVVTGKRKYIVTADQKSNLTRLK